MTIPRDAIGLSERLREVERAELDVASQADCRPEDTANYVYAGTCREAATALDALQARGKELEGELVDTQAALTGVNSDWAKAESRATRAEQERDEAVALLTRVNALAQMPAWRRMPDGASFNTTPLAGDIYAAMRRLAAGTEKEGK